MDPLMSPTRKPAVAGQFYPGSQARLDQTVKDMAGAGPTRKALGVMVPHAGYMYSGPVAGAVFGSVELPEAFIILGPNHTGMGPSASIMTAGVWQMPDGDVTIDEGLASAILSNSSTLTADDSAHAFEHSIEVQLPFLQNLTEDVRFVPICLMTGDARQCRDVGLAVAAAVKSSQEPVLIIASSDMTHYENREAARYKDELALEQMLKLDADGLLETVRRNNISMCGYAPAASMLYACRELGATRATLIKYATSGDVTGDYAQVVGYAGVVVE